MKAFGLRLAAGVATILFGAYAAALAQKDKQNDPSAWTAQAPSLGEPAAPIAGIEEDTWISQPGDGSANSRADFAGNSMNAAAVALVQHEEPIHEEPISDNQLRSVDSLVGQSPQGSAFDMASLPASLGDPQAEVHSDRLPSDDSGFAASDSPFAVPAQTNTGQSEQLQAMTMQVPDWAVEEQLASQENQQTFAEPNQPLANDVAEPANDFAGQPAAPAPAGMAIEEQSLSMNFSSETPPSQLAAETQPLPEMELAQAPMMDAYPQPRNPSANYYTNHLRDGSQPAGLSSTGLAADPGLAQNQLQPPPQFQQPQTFQQPAQNQFPGDAYANPQDRLASLSPDAIARPSSNVADGTVDSPGDRRLEGIQTPSIVIQKRAPAEVKVGKPASFVIHVQNTGSAEALDVRVHDRVPAGMRLVDASPAPTQQGNLLLWQLGALPAGDERTVTMQLVPEAEGELGSVARVTFQAAASVRTISTRPELKIVQNAPPKVLIGQQLEIELEVSNPGTGEATGVSLQEDVPDGLDHPRGRQLDNMIGTLRPGESRRQVLRLRATKPGMIVNTIRLVSEDGLTDEHSINVEVISPELQVELTGPSRRFLERQATYQLNIANTGTASATNVEVAVALDRGFNFVSTEYEGQYDPSRHAVYWSLDSLPAGESGSVPLTLLPVQEGQRALTVDARADLNTVAKSEHMVQVEGLAELSFQILNPGGPIELGAESDYEITVQNSGSKSDSNVRLQMLLPAGLELISADGDGGQAGTDGRGLVEFPPQAQLAAGSETKYRVKVRGVAPGTHLVKAVVVSDSATVPVTKEESTLVYSDR